MVSKEIGPARIILGNVNMLGTNNGRFIVYMQPLLTSYTLLLLLLLFEGTITEEDINNVANCFVNRSHSTSAADSLAIVLSFFT
jgi:hypothetical protein